MHILEILHNKLCSATPYSRKVSPARSVEHFGLSNPCPRALSEQLTRVT